MTASCRKSRHGLFGSVFMESWIFLFDLLMLPYMMAQQNSS